ncbi:hypothetical protein DyAD56_21190 [Dyella sp. AD56]|nr:hypothetical protein DyAD56_21190 [Dyella sp. AD56]
MQFIENMCNALTTECVALFFIISLLVARFSFPDGCIGNDEGHPRNDGKVFELECHEYAPKTTGLQRVPLDAPGHFRHKNPLNSWFL